MSEKPLRYIQIKELIIHDIRQLPPHTRLPSRTALADKYKAARTTIERAISELIGEKYLYARDGSGTYVAEVSGKSSAHLSNPIFGLVIPNIMHDTYPGILRGVEDVANEHGMNVVLCNTDNKVDKESAYIQKLIHSDVKGVIIVPAIIGKTNMNSFQKLEEASIPMVFCNRGIDGVSAPRVISNNFYGAYLSVKHLIATGRQRIAYISRPLYSTSNDRYQGYISALTEANMEQQSDYVIFESSFNGDLQGYKSAKQLLSLDPAPDALFCFNDAIAKGAYDAVTEAGLQVGEDIGIVGYDNTHVAERLPVKLTSVKFQTYDIGKQAAEWLVRMINKETLQENKTVVLQPELIIRQSTQPQTVTHK